MASAYSLKTLFRFAFASGITSSWLVSSPWLTADLSAIILLHMTQLTLPVPLKRDLHLARTSYREISIGSIILSSIIMLGAENSQQVHNQDLVISSPFVNIPLPLRGRIMNPLRPAPRAASTTSALYDKLIRHKGRKGIYWMEANRLLRLPCGSPPKSSTILANGNL
jgi:hypothetical protein